MILASCVTTPVTKLLLLCGTAGGRAAAACRYDLKAAVIANPPFGVLALGHSSGTVPLLDSLDDRIADDRRVVVRHAGAVREEARLCGWRRSQQARCVKRAGAHDWQRLRGEGVRAEVDGYGMRGFGVADLADDGNRIAFSGPEVDVLSVGHLAPTEYSEGYRQKCSHWVDLHENVRRADSAGLSAVYPLQCVETPKMGQRVSYGRW